MLYFLEIKANEQCEYIVTLLGSEKGNIPAAAIVGRTKSSQSPIQPSEFTPNPDFLRLLHHCVERFGPQSPNLLKEAARQKDGIIYVIDARNQNPLGAVPPEDIIGAFQVRGCHVHPETYRANPNYRLLTMKGFFVLDQYIHEKLLDQLTKCS